MDAGDIAVLRRKIILKPGRHANHLTFDVCRDADESIFRVTIADEPIERADAGDIECRRTGKPCSRRRFRIGNHIKTGFGFEKINEFRQQFETRLVFQFADFIERTFERHAAIN